jgi:microcin C transport system ATP-binding protein
VLEVDDLKVWFPSVAAVPAQAIPQAVDGISQPESSAARPWASSANRLGKSTLGQAILRLIDSEAASAFRATPLMG